MNNKEADNIKKSIDVLEGIAKGCDAYLAENSSDLCIMMMRGAAEKQLAELRAELAHLEKEAAS
ncbi:MAG: hypothetical protein LBC18_08760 [Opitutaceae bacterium]|jgi:hypothetical protein|nr:hypothetical protein [Opitutaceae bacterium]